MVDAFSDLGGGGRVIEHGDALSVVAFERGTVVVHLIFRDLGERFGQVLFERFLHAALVIFGVSHPRFDPGRGHLAPPGLSCQNT